MTLTNRNGMIATVKERTTLLPDETTSRFINLFFPRQDIHALQMEDGSYILQREAVTQALLDAHFRGEVTLGTYALSAGSKANWVALDADNDDEWQAILKLVQGLNLPLYLEGSRRGGHAWGFFAEKHSGTLARQFGIALMKLAKIEQLEVFPKQEAIGDGIGSLVRLPFGYHRKAKVFGKPGKRFSFYQPDGTPLATSIHEQIQMILDGERLTFLMIETLINLIPDETPKPRRTRQFVTHPVDSGFPLSERIKDSISVFDFVGQYVDLKPSGRGRCPFHDDTHDSFGVNTHKNYWSCFAGCGGGSVIDFWSQYRQQVLSEDGDFVATIRDLAQLLGL